MKKREIDEKIEKREKKMKKRQNIAETLRGPGKERKYIGEE